MVFSGSKTHKLSSLVIIFMFLANVFMVVVTVNASDPIYIMPLGDSITLGNANGGYRQKLYLDLTDDGFNVDFVGNQSDPDSPDPWFDTDHEGHPGWHANQIRDNVYDWLELNPADFVLLHIGTNDISYGDKAQNVKNEVNEILDNIDLYEDDYNKDITVFLARIILRTDDVAKNETTKAFNDALEDMALDRIADGDDIIIVDMENALTYPDDMASGVHPNAVGYQKMADVWYNAIYTKLVNDLVLTVEGVQSWYWIDDTVINSVFEADVDGDGAVEIVTAGYYNDGARDVAQLVVWDGTTLAVEHIRTWYWTSDTRINSVAVADVDGDTDMEIVTGGYHTGVVKISQLVVWDGATLAVEYVTSWYWTSDTEINSVAVADVDGDTDLEIVTGGYYNDKFRDVAQLVVWDGTTLAVENIRTWYWTSDTRINSVAVADVDDDTDMEIVTGGYYFNGVRDVAQLVTWDGATLALEPLTVWYWTGNTRINSVAIGDVDGDGADEIVTGGYYTDGVKIAQLVVWNGTSMTVENLSSWYWTAETVINSGAIGNVDGDGDVEIVTGGYYFDGVRDVAQLVVWDGSTLEVEPLTVWYWTSDTRINSVAIGNVDADVSEEIVTGGYYDDGSNVNAQLIVWAITPY